jgi:hypothetical protein
MCISYQSRSQSWVWAHNFGKNDEGKPPTMDYDAAGNVVVGGFPFLAKYNAAGTLLWRKDELTGFLARVMDVCFDASGNIIVAGTFEDSVSFGTVKVYGTGLTDIFVVKYDGAGNVLWVKKGGSAGIDEVSSVAADTTGNVFVAGWFPGSSIDFDATTLTGTSDASMFLVKYSPGGSVQWGRALSSSGSWPNYCRASAIATDGGGDVFVTGEFTGTAMTVGTTTLTGTGGPQRGEVYVAKYNAAGTVMWARSGSSGGYDVAYEIATDAAGNCYVTGTFQGITMQIGMYTLANASASGTADVFVLSYSGGGTERWARRIGCAGFDESLSIDADNAGNVYVTNTYGDATLTFGPDTLTNAAFAEWGRNGMVARYTTNGTEQWAVNVGGTNGEAALAVVADNAGSIYICGVTVSPTLTMGATVLNRTGAFFGDYVVAKLSGTNGVPTIAREATGIKIYPNPVGDELVITYGEQMDKVSIIDVWGREVCSNTVNGKEVRINTKGIAAGVYQVVVNNSVASRFVKI